MNIEDIKRMSDQDIYNLKELLDQEAADREKKAEYLDRFKDLFNDAKRDGIVLGIYNAMTGDLIKVRDCNCLYVGKF